MKPPIPQPGDAFEIPYPFVRDGGEHSDFLWKPGVRKVDHPTHRTVLTLGADTHNLPDTRRLADAIGAQIVTVVSAHKPGKFPTRVFFTRQWRDPDGAVFGKGLLRCASLGRWRRTISGYAHPFEMTRAIAEPEGGAK